MKVQFILLGVAVAALGLCVLFAKHPTAPASAAWLSYGHDDQVAYWTERIHVLGASAAYQEFASQVPDTAAEHEKAHAFGGALYQAVGLRGITTCDFRFQYGCFHEFIGKAVADQGLDIISKIDAACQQAVGPSGCRHGIGHALMYYYGYTLDGLKQALASCDTYTKTYPYEGCYAGVFMEFNTQIMMGDDGVARPLEHNDYRYPCADLDQHYQAVCAYHQTRWWNTLSQVGQYNFARMGDLCRAFDLGDKARVACFAGLGVVAGDALNYDKTTSAGSSCDSAGATEGERLACRAIAAAFIYSATGLGAQSAQAACQGLDGDALAYCTSYTTDKSAFVFVTPMPPRYGASF